MQSRRRFSLFGGVVFVLVLTLRLQPAHGAIWLTFSDGNPADTQTFVSPSNQLGSFATSLAGIEVVANVVSSNFPGTAAGANLIQSININDPRAAGSGTLPTLTFTATLADVGGNPLHFTGPTNSVLRVSSDVTNVEPIFQSTLGTVQNTTTVNGVNVASAIIPINGSAPANQALAANTPSGFTISSTIVLTGAAVGTSLSIGSTSAVVGVGDETVASVPEPSTLLNVVGLGGLGLILSALKRCRRSHVKAQPSRS